MTTTQLAKPNYENWAKRDTWNLNASAFLINDIDPDTYKSIRLAQHDVPAEFEKAKQTLSFLQSVPWSARYSNYYFKNLGIVPAAVVGVLLSKGMDMPEELRTSVEEYYQQEIAHVRSIADKSIINFTSHTDQENSVGNRERRSWQSGFALLTRVLAKKIGRVNADNEIAMSSSQLLQMMLDEAESIGFPVDGIKSFDRKITQSLNLIKDESSC